MDKATTATGKIYQRDRYLCDVTYAISEPVRLEHYQIQHLHLIVPDEQCATFVDGYGLCLVMADGNRVMIPRPIRQIHPNHFECYIERPL